MLVERGIPPWLVAAFHSLNHQHFGGRLPPPRRLGLMPNRGYNAMYFPFVHFIRFDAAILAAPETAKETLLHEMIHYTLALRSGFHDPTHGAAFTAEANRIGAAMGWRSVQAYSREAGVWPAASKSGV